MRLLVLTADYGSNVWSGIGTAVTYQVEALTSRGHDLHIVTPSRPELPPRADAIHLHSLALATIALRLKTDRKLPLLYTAHSLLDKELAGRPNTASWIALQQTVFDSADHVCFVSRAERDAALRQFPSLAARSTVVPNGVPDAPGPSNAHPDGPVVFAGRFTRNKGADVAARIAPLVFDCSKSMQIVFAGGHGDAAETSSIDAVAARYPQQCRVTGWLQREALHALLSTASAVIVPSRYEPFGMVALEAMRLGVPVLATSIGGLAEIVQPGAGGLLIHSLKPEKWAEKCLELREDRTAWNRFNYLGPRWVSAKFHVNLTAVRLEGILTGIMRQCPIPPAGEALLPALASNHESPAGQKASSQPAMQDGTAGILSGKIVLVTGGSRGIGLAICRRLAAFRPEHIVIVYCLDHDAARRAVADLKDLGVDASAHCVDVSREDLLRQLFEDIKSRFGKLDIFISNAARASFEPVAGLSTRTWQRTVDLNARAFLLGSQLSAPLMNNGGRIIGITSLGSRFYTPGYAALGAAKAMIESMARYLAVELAPAGINVNVVCGGFIDTDSTRLLPGFDAVSEQIAARTPARRIGRPEDIAGVVSFLCTPDSDWMRGQTLVADGGYTLCT